MQRPLLAWERIADSLIVTWEIWWSKRELIFTFCPESKGFLDLHTAAIFDVVENAGLFGSERS
jgi:hypothetical protein